MNTLIITEAVLIIKGETTVQLRISAVLLRKAGRWDVPYAINQGYEVFCTYSNEMLSDFGRHELTIKEYETIFLAKEMYARGAEYVKE